MARKLLNLTWSEIRELITLLRIDVYFFLFAMGHMMPDITLSQFIQDKHCINGGFGDANYCLTLQQSNETVHKDAIIAFSTEFRNRQTIIMTPPGIILSLFMGYWIETYPTHLKYLLAFPCFGGCCASLVYLHNMFSFESDVNLLYWASPILGFSGGISLVITGTYTYMAKRTRTKYRAARFAIFQLFMFSSMPIGTALAGKLLTLDVWFAGQHRNYLGVVLVSMASQLISMIWILMLLNDAADEPIESSKRVQSVNEKLTNEEKTYSLVLTKDPMNNDIKSIGSGDGDYSTINFPMELEPLKADQMVDSLNSEPNKPDKVVGCLPVALDIFNPTTVVNMVKICTRKRPNGGRAIIWHLMLTMNVCLMRIMADAAIGYQFSQTVYNWTAQYYSYVHSLGNVLPSLVSSLLPIVLIHKFHLSDIMLSIIGSSSLVLSTVMRGAILHEGAYYASIVAGLCGGLTMVTVRSVIARLVDPKETGVVFAFLACLESVTPMISSSIATKIFNNTLVSCPGAVYLLSGLTLTYPLAISIWLEYTRYRWDPSYERPDANGKPKQIEI